MTMMPTPHRRLNLLTNQWVLVSPQRENRPWNGQVTPPQVVPKQSYDEKCYLCPGNRRAGNHQNPAYENVFIFENDFPAIESDMGNEPWPDPHFKSQPICGICKVICYSPQHDLSLATMTLTAIEKVIYAWIQESTTLSKQYRWVQIFENHGEKMGCSNPHPHGQIWALNQLPNEATAELTTQKEFFENHRTTLLGSYLKRELDSNERLVFETKHWAVIVPYWAVWPFETLLLPKRHVTKFSELHSSEISDLAHALKILLTTYNALFHCDFPYSMGWHGAPNLEPSPHFWQLHAHFYPPLLRSSEVQKYMVGYELLAEPQRDLTPETAAARLRQHLPTSAS